MTTHIELSNEAEIHDVEIKQPDVDIDHDVKHNYEEYKKGRESKKVLFSLFTLGFGALYLWARTRIVPQGTVGVRVSRDGQYIVLPSGRHSNLPGEEWRSNQNLAQDEVTLGAKRIVTIKDGFRGESYKQGRLVVLPPGRHLLDSQHILSKTVSTGDDIIDLGPKKIVTVKAGQVGICYHKGVLNILKEGRHEVTLPDEVWKGYMSLRQEVIELPSLEIKTTDNINVTCHAVLNYKIVDPIKAITCVDNLEASLTQLAEVALSAILRRFSFRDLSPVPGEEEEEAEEETTKKEKGKGKSRMRAAHFASKMQAKMHDEIHADFEKIVEGWGVEIIGSVQLKTVVPSDDRLRMAIAEMAINTAKADAQRRQAEFERQVRNTQAQADKEASILKAEGKAESQMIESRGKQQAQILDAKAEAEAIRIISLAKLESTENEAKGAEALMKTPIAQQLAVLQRQSDILAKCKTPVYIPGTSMGTMNVWSKNEDANTISFFTNNPPSQNGTGQSQMDTSNSLLVNALINKEFK